MNTADFCALTERWAAVMADNRSWLIELDSVVGDSDRGLTMSDGFCAAADAVAKNPGADVSKTAYLAGKAMAAAVPSTMGTLMASGLMNAGKMPKGVKNCNAKQEVDFFRAYFDGVRSRGKAELGDKTFLDGLYPAIEALDHAIDSGKTEAEAARLAAQAAWAAFENTKGMLARHGRMAIRGEQSRELLDPGAAVAALLMKGYADYKADSE